MLFDVKLNVPHRVRDVIFVEEIFFCVVTRSAQISCSIRDVSHSSEISVPLAFR